MRKFITIIMAALLTAGAMSAQDVAGATELYNNGATALSSGKKTDALDYFKKSLDMAAKLGDEGKEVAQKCKDVIPNLYVSIAKDLIKAADFDGAVAKLNEAAKIAGEFNAADVAKDALALIPQVSMQKGASLLAAKNFAGAVEAYKTAVAADTTNGAAYLRLGQAIAGTGNIEGAVEAFKSAANHGQEQNANKQIATIFLKKAAGALKVKDYAGAVAAAIESNNYVESAQALQIAGQGSQILKKNKDAIKYFEKYLQVSPSAKNAAQIAYTVGALYQQDGNKAKAIEFYQKVASDPVLGAEAKKLIDSLK